MPRAGYSSVGTEDPQLQWRPVMGAFRTHSMSLAVQIGQQDLAIFNSFYLNFSLLSTLQVELGETLDLVLLCHIFRQSCERRYWEFCRSWRNTEDESR